MKYKIINLLMFAAGAAIGSAVTWKVVKDKYEQIVQEEIQSIKEAFCDRAPNDEDQSESSDDADVFYDDGTVQISMDDLEDLDEEDNEDDGPDDMTNYTRIVGNYTNEKGGAEKMVEKPYVIAPYDFGELDGYSQVELTYYADGTLEDDEYNIVTDVDELIGSDSLFTFGEYEDDSVFVRNERLRADFQILKDYRTYEEARSVSPKQVDDE